MITITIKICQFKYVSNRLYSYSWCYTGTSFQCGGRGGFNPAFLQCGSEVFCLTTVQYDKDPDKHERTLNSLLTV